ncbi:MAG: hypothetical protein HFI22_04355 [Lachnospiraceae bacterium]|jgi:hypothetical protein|nr:hypothetical protein [Lachnospiraceae bacterium]
MKERASEKGAVMVEAAIYVPLVLCTVMALIYLALFNMQEYMMMYQAQRVAAVVAREEAYTGYDSFGMGAHNQIDFDWGSGNYPSEAELTAYYKAHNSTLSAMYREIGSLLHLAGVPGPDPSKYTSRFGNAAIDASLLALGTISQPEIGIEYGILGTEVTVEIEHSIPTPGVMRYLGLPDGLTMYEAAYTYSINPSEFVRNVDLAVDLTSYIFEKLGLSDKYNSFLKNTSEVLGKIL